MVGSSASIALSGCTLGDERGVLPSDSFVLGYDEAWVAQGSYSGIRVVFKTQSQGADFHELTFLGNFECSSKETECNASGRFEVDGGGVGVSKVD